MRASLVVRYELREERSTNLGCCASLKRWSAPASARSTKELP